MIPGVARLRPTSDAAPYEYVASLGIFTPAELTGVQRVTARAAYELAEKGAKLVDVRTEKEYATKHARGAVNLPVRREEPEGNRLRREEGPVRGTCEPQQG